MSSHVFLSLTVEAAVENLPSVNAMIDGTAQIPDDVKPVLLVIAEEIFVNICSYSYGDGRGNVTVALDIFGNSVSLTFTDSGKPFDPTAGVPAIEDYDHDNDIGGLGRFLVFELADDHSYRYSDGKNILTVTKRFDNNP